MRKLLLTLLGSSIGWALALQVPAVDARQEVASSTDLLESRSEVTQTAPISSSLSCTPQEREEALSKFGCSCTTCISAVQQLQGQTSLRQLMFGTGKESQASVHPHQALGVANHHHLLGK